MTGRTFPEQGIPDGPRGRRQAFRITCSACGTEAFFPILSNGMRRPHIAAQQHFQHEGWVVGSSHRKDRCPKCVLAKKEKPMPKSVPVEAPVALKADPPREMTRADRRIIMEKLDEVYGDQCYKTPWTDAALAKDLGTPRAWISEVRDQCFGPEGSNPLFDEFESRLEAVAPKVVSIVDKAKNLFDQVYQLRQQTEDVAKEMADLKRIGGRIEREIGR